MAWQPIETAPKDGGFVLLHCPNGQLESGDVTIGAYWKSDERAESGRFLKGNWDGWLGMDVDIASSWCNPTHWMPLPPPPATEGDSQSWQHVLEDGSFDHEWVTEGGITFCAQCEVEKPVE